jgi:hypothetical protein
MEWYKDPEWWLRIGIFGSFLGHGLFALGGVVPGIAFKTGWVPYFTAVGMTEAHAATLLPLIGVMDLLVAAFALFKPIKVVLAWAAIWGFWTALLRPIAGQPVWDFVERWANWAAPMALLALKGFPKKAADWWKE